MVSKARLTKWEDLLLSALSIILVGLVLGMRHATDPDHVIAVTTIVSRQRSIRQAALVGIVWGLGHTLTIFAVGTAIILFKLTIPPRLGLAMEFAVGMMLVLLGVLSLSGVLERLRRLLGTAHETLASVGPVNAAVEDKKSQLVGKKDRVWFLQLVRPLIVGIVHGLAGSAAVALLVLATIANPYGAIAYLLVFGVGTMAGMMVITAAIAMPFAYTGLRSSRWNHGLTLASGLVSLCFGLFLTYQVGFVGGLFTIHPRWTPN